MTNPPRPAPPAPATENATRAVSATRRAVFAAIVFALAFAHGLLRIDREFIGDREGTACGLVMMPPINYLRYGPFAQRLGGIINPGEVARENRTAYVHHPPGVTITSAIAHLAFGRADWVARLAPTLFASLTATLLFAAIAGGGHLRLAALSAAIFTFVPFTVMYGGMPDYVNFQVVFFSTLALWLWLRSLASARPIGLRAASMLAFFAACASDWPGFYVGPVIWLGTWAIRRRLDRFWHLAFPAVAVGLLLLLAGWMQWAGSDQSLLARVMLRSAGGQDRGEGSIGIGRWLSGVTGSMALLHTLPALVCTVVVIGLTVAASFSRAAAARIRGAITIPPFVLALVGVLAVHFVVARQGCFQHEWWHVVFTPAIACCAAAVLDAILRPLDRARWGGAVAAGISVALIVLLARHSAALDASRRRDFADAGGYTLRELGEAIARATAPAEGVLTSDSSDWVNGYAQSPLGWYADRQMRPCIVDVARLRAALAAGPYPVFFGYQQRWGPAPVRFVMPAAHRGSRAELADHLDAHFPSTLDGGFYVYDLTRAK